MNSPSFSPPSTWQGFHKLSLYDAVYLELAKREDAALATLDSALARAATLGGVQLFS